LYKREKTEIVKGEIVRRNVYYNKYGDEVEKVGETYTVKKSKKHHKNDQSYEFPNMYHLIEKRNQGAPSIKGYGEPELDHDMLISLAIGIVLFLTMWFLLAYSIGYRQARKYQLTELQQHTMARPSALTTS
jgi:hypothetical protein